MKRWVVFDSSTAHAAYTSEREIDLRESDSVSDALREAVQSQRPIVLVLPAGGDKVTVARITPPDSRRG